MEGAATTEMTKQLRHITGFSLGALPIRYLGVPLVLGRLSYQDCSSIVEKVHKHLAGWKNRSLSYTGRLTLIKSIPYESYIYWSRIFGLPGKLKKQIESLFARFMWSGLELKKKIHVVTWENVCKLFEEGVLNIRRVKDMNNAGVMKHVWWLATNKENLWVRWIHEKYLNKNPSRLLSFQVIVHGHCGNS